MDDSARPHRARVMTYYLRDESITTLPWPAMRSPDLIPIEHFRRFRAVLADSNRWGNHSLFKTVVLANAFHLTNRPKALSSSGCNKGISDRGRSLTSLVNRCLLAIRLTVEFQFKHTYT
jgi:hypothetical protein